MLRRCSQKNLRTQVHGARMRTRRPLYMKWFDMNRRCHNPNRRDYPNYGGRGITVCERWRNSFEKFCADLAHLGPCPKGYTIDRIDNSKGYEPGNVKWSTYSEQNRNKRRARRGAPTPNPDWLSYRARLAPVDYQTVWARVHRLGWPVERAVTLPRGAKLEAFA